MDQFDTKYMRDFMIQSAYMLVVMDYFASKSQVSFTNSVNQISISSPAFAVRFFHGILIYTSKWKIGGLKSDTAFIKWNEYNYGWGSAKSDWGGTISSWGRAYSKWESAHSIWGSTFSKWGSAKSDWGSTISSWECTFSNWGSAKSSWGRRV